MFSMAAPNETLARDAITAIPADSDSSAKPESEPDPASNDRAGRSSERACASPGFFAPAAKP